MGAHVPLQAACRGAAKVTTLNITDTRLLTSVGARVGRQAAMFREGLTQPAQSQANLRGDLDRPIAIANWE